MDIQPVELPEKFTLTLTREEAQVLRALVGGLSPVEMERCVKESVMRGVVTTVMVEAFVGEALEQLDRVLFINDR